MKNPFVFSKLVKGENFCDRKELLVLKKYIENAQNVVLFSKRRYGKSSLIKELFENHLSDDFLCIYADIYAINDENSLAGVLYKSSASAFKLDFSSLLKTLKELFSRASFSINLANNGEIELEPRLTSKSIEESLEDIFSSLEKYAKKEGKKVVFAIDEFQQISALEHKVEALFRSYTQSLEHVCFVFLGSKEHLLTQIFTSPKRAFYKSSALLELEVINQDSFFSFCQKKFCDTNKILEKTAFELLYTLSKGESWLVQNICYHLWEKYDNISISELKDCIFELIDMQDGLYRNFYERFSQNQQIALNIVAKSADKQNQGLLNKENLLDFNISKASLASALKSLEKDEIIIKQSSLYEIYDTLFALWIRKKINKSDIF